MHTGDRYLEVDVKSGLTIYPLGVGLGGGIRV
jgi:hypothetical protein